MRLSKAMYTREQGQPVSEATGVKGLAQGPKVEIILLAMGFELATFQSQES